MYREDTLLHYFYPRYSNNQKAKLLHNTSLLLIVFLLFAYQLFLQFLPSVGVKILGYAANIPPSEVINLTNQKRESYGLGNLQYSVVLEEAARAKGEHMLANDYWAHVAPDGTEPWYFFTNSGYKYRYAGENLARDFSNPQSAIDAWMASPSHKENMLSSKYTEVGVAVVEGDLNGVDTTIVVQLFGTRLDNATVSIPVAGAKPKTATAAPVPATTITQEEIIPTSAPVVVQITPIPTLSGEKILQGETPVAERVSGFQLLLSPFETTRSISFVTLGVLTIVMVIDAVVVLRKRIARIGGRSFAHIAFIVMILGLVLMSKAGKIL